MDTNFKCPQCGTNLTAFSCGACGKILNIEDQVNLIRTLIDIEMFNSATANKPNS